MSEHSPTPWEVVETTEHHGPYIITTWGTTICDLYTMSNPMVASVRNGGDSFPVHFTDADANAAFIVKAVNSHDALIAALIGIAAFDDIGANDRLATNGSYSGFDEPGGVRVAREALASIKEAV